MTIARPPSPNVPSRLEPITLSADACDDLTFSAPTRLRPATARSSRSRPRRDARFRAHWQQSPLRAGILRDTCTRARPERSARRRGPRCRRSDGCGWTSRTASASSSTSASRDDRRATPPRTSAERPSERGLADLLDLLPRAARRGQHRGSVAVGPALPRDDRPRREDADRLRVDPHRRQVGHLGADPRADRIGQGSRGPDDPRAEPPAATPSSRRSTAPRCPTRCSNRKSSATRRARSPARTIASRDALELANDGTLFLDEIGDMSLIAQAKLLRVPRRAAVRAAGRQQVDLTSTSG